MKILFLSPNYRKRTNWGHQLFRDEVIRSTHLHDGAMQYGEGCEYSGKTYIPDIVAEVSAVKDFGAPDVIIMENQKNMQKYTGFNKVDCLRVIYLGDYLPDVRGNIGRYNDLINHNEIHLALCPTPRVRRLAIQQQIQGHLREECRLFFLPYSVDLNIYKPRPHLSMRYDVMAVFGLVSYVYPRRPAVQKMIAEMPGIKSLIGDWSSKLRHHDYASAISQSRMFVSVNGVNNQITMKYTEAMASGSLLLTNEPEDFSAMGYKAGEHCVVWETLAELNEKIYYYKAHEKERRIIADCGRQFVQQFYSTKTVTRRMLMGINNEKADAENSGRNGGFNRSLY